MPTKSTVLTLLLAFALLFSACGIRQRGLEPERATPEPSATALPLEVAPTVEPVAATTSVPATASPTVPIPSPTNTPLPTEVILEPTSTQTAGPTPLPEENLLVNGTFANGSFAGWNQVNGYWTAPPAALHRSVSCSPSGTWYLQMDRDVGPNGWPAPPSEDWAWQDVSVPGPHSTLFLHYEEGHHMKRGIIELTVYGRQAGGDWETVFHQLGVQSPFGTGKCDKHGPPATYDYAIPITAPYDEYRLEVHGQMIDPEDGVLWGDFRLSVK